MVEKHPQYNDQLHRQSQRGAMRRLIGQLLVSQCDHTIGAKLEVEPVGIAYQNELETLVQVRICKDGTSG